MNIRIFLYPVEYFLLGIFNTRELATIFWLLVAIILIMLWPDIRRSVFNVIRSLFGWKFIVAYLIAFTYIVFIVTQLTKFNFWELYMLKDTIYWSIFSGTVLMYKVGVSKEPIGLLKSILIASLQFSVIIQFIANLETFSFWLELLVIPLTLLFVGMYEGSKHNKESVLVTKVLGNAGTLLSIIAFGYIVYFSLTNYEKYINIQTAKLFALPIIMTFCFTPLLAVLNLAVQYEDVSPSVRRFAKSKHQYYWMMFLAFFYFNFNIKGLIRWLQSLPTKDLHGVKAIISSIKEIKLQQKKERIPPDYPELHGWLPQHAKNFLKYFDLEITNYQSELGKIWKGSSKVKLNDDFMTGKCIYEISGTKYVVKEMKLQLVVFDSSRMQDVEEFIKIADLLFHYSLYIDIPNIIKTGIVTLQDLEYEDDLGDISLRIYRWKNEKKGYDLYLSIRHQEKEAD